MADAEHLALLVESGVGAWNEWRANNPRTETLSVADLSGAWLSGIVAELNLPRPVSVEELAVEKLPRIAGESGPDRGT